MSDDTQHDTQHDDSTTHDSQPDPRPDSLPDTLRGAQPETAPAEAGETTPDAPVELGTAPVKAARWRARRPVVATFAAPDESVSPTSAAAPADRANVVADADASGTESDAEPDAEEPTAPRRRRARRPAAMPTFQAVDPAVVAAAEKAAAEQAAAEEEVVAELAAVDAAEGADDDEAEPGEDAGDDEGTGDGGPRRRRRGRRGRGRGRGDGSADGDGSEQDGPVASAGDEPSPADEKSEASDDDDAADGPAGTRRRRRRRRTAGGEGGEQPSDDPPNTVVKVREPRAKKAADADGVRGVSGSTRLEAKRQRRRDGRTGARRAPIVTESEYLARREAVARTMVVRNQGERTQIAVLEDGVLVEHYVTRASASSYAGNVYLGKVQNVLPSMEAAFVDIGKGRNAVLYAGEVNYETAGLDGGRAHSIQEALKSGQNVLSQVTKDPIGQKGARLTSQVTLPGRYLVYVPEGSMTGISRKLPDTERARLKSILKRIVPDDAGVIIRTAAEGASEEELARDVERLQQQWEDIQAAAKKAEKHAPALLHAEPDLVVRVVRDVFNEDFTSLVVSGDAEWETIEAYVSSVAPDLLDRVSRWTSEIDVFTEHRVTEQLVRALDRKVHLPSGGSLVIDRTEAMTVVDVNTGKFTGKGGNLEETVTKNNLEAAEEIVRQLRLRDVGGIIVIDFIDMVLESNRELVLRRMTECLGRDRTRHQVAEVTSLGLVQMTRKRVGTGLLEAYSEPCLACQGRGVLIHLDGPPVKAAAPVLAVRGRSPVPRPPSVRPAPEDGDAVIHHADEGAEPGESADLDSSGLQSPVATGPDSSGLQTPEATDLGGTDAPVAPKRRRRRATSGGPVSAIPEDVGVS